MENDGNVSVTNLANTRYIGGIFGNALMNNAYSYYNMINKGRIDAYYESTRTTYYTYDVGGIAGYMTAPQAVGMTNLGIINIYHKYYDVMDIGGLFGQFKNTKANATSEDWLNTGSIMIDNGFIVWVELIILVD